MDLTSFTNKKEEKKKILVDDKDVLIEQQGKNITFTLKTKDALKTYEEYLFFSPTNSIVTDNEEEGQKFFEQSIKDGVEGLMIKSLNSEYKSGLRTGAMVKLKETKEDIDVVILAAEHGTGKRAVYYSSFYVGVRNPEYSSQDDEFLGIGKVSSGIKELDEEGASLKKLTELLEPLKLKEEKSVTYFEPQVVIEVRYQEIQKSTAYNSGYALRFPRIINLREDKDIDEVNTIDDIERFV